MGGKLAAVTRLRTHSRAQAWALSAVAVLLANSSAAQLGPQNVVREFCRLDALGARATLQGWPQVAPLVAWQLEPAWDRVVLITSYTVGWPVAEADDVFAIEVRYAVQGTVTATGFEQAPTVEARRYRVEPSDDGTWRIAAPPPPPHIFSHDVDIPAMQQSLQRGGVNFLPNSLFVWELYRRNGWEIPFEHTLALTRTQVFRRTEKATAGDVVLYLDEDTPYHVGVLESEDVVVSSTLNAGIVRTPVDAFAGTRRVLHLRPPEFWPATPTPRLSPEAFSLITPTPTAATAPPRKASTEKTKRTRQDRSTAAKSKQRRKTK
ncbi:MAG: hypothetical protein N3C12_12900 [Candidatus Binatia bacterium]|nr:hypothetical protein [Candidatus Binatia bacterium]